MDQQATTHQAHTQAGPGRASKGTGGVQPNLILDKNFGLSADEKPWSEFLATYGISAEATFDLPHIDRSPAAHKGDIAYIPIADFHHPTGSGDRFCRELAMAMSKFTGQAKHSALLVVHLGQLPKDL